MEESSTSQEYSTPERIILEITRVFEPLTDAARDLADGNPITFRSLCKDVGIDVEEIDEELEPIEETLSDLGTALETIESIIEKVEEGNPPTRDELGEARDAVSDVVDSIRQLDEISLPDVRLDSGVGTLLLDHLLVSYLERHHRNVRDALRVADVIQETSGSGPPKVEFSQLPTALSDPATVFEASLSWGMDDFDPVIVLYYLRRVAWELSLPARFEGTTAIEELADEPVEEGVKADHLGLTVPALIVGEQENRGAVGIRIVPVPRPEGLPGLAIVPYGDIEAAQEHELGGGWSMHMSASGGFDDYGIVAFHDTSPELRSLEDDDDGPAELHGEVVVTGESSGEGTSILGDPDTGGIVIDSVGLEALVHYEGDELVVSLALPTTGSLSLQPDSFDGFLSDVMPDDGIAYEFEVTLGWSSKEGLFFNHGGSLEVTIPQHRSLGPIEILETYLSIQPDSLEEADDDQIEGKSNITFTGATSAVVELGPVTGTVRRIGLEATAVFPEEEKPLPPDLDITFKPPSGIGLEVDLEGVSGGGFIYFEPEKNRYAGGLELKIGDLELDAVGLLKTELPGGEDGYSFLVIITADFPSGIELGFGFSLQGVGGLLGIHRSMQLDPLGEAVRSGNIDSVLFPENVTENADRIISDLRSIFPPTADQHVFGPMVKLTWGTPTIITGDLGVIVQVPELKIAILGRLSAILPNEDAELIALNMDVLGVIYPAEELVELEAHLFDSHVVGLPISGGMAMRLRGGDNPQFILSLGGFHPEYDPPGDFPEIDRLSISLPDISSRVTMEIESYFAVTSNTVQFGAALDFWGGFSSAHVEAFFELDALFQFDPFQFIIDLAAGIYIEVGPVSTGFEFSGTLKGPSPYEIDGYVEVDVTLFSTRVSISLEFGNDDGADGLPPAEVLPELVAAIEKPENWSARRPEAGDPIGPLRDPETAEDAVLVHPLGELSVRQTIVPLETEIETFGTAQPAGPRKFAIGDVSLANTEESGGAIERGAETYEKFAPAEYYALDDEEKLDRDAFESMPAGYRVDTGNQYDGGHPDDPTDEETRAQNTRVEKLVYRTYVEDERQETWMKDLSTLGDFDSEALGGEPFEVAKCFDRVGGVATGAKRSSGTDRFRSHDPTGSDEEPAEGSVDDGVLSGQVSLGSERFVVARTDTMEPVDLPTAPEGPMRKGEAKTALKRHLEDNPRDEDRLHVVAKRRLD